MTDRIGKGGVDQRAVEVYMSVDYDLAAGSGGKKLPLDEVAYDPFDQWDATAHEFTADVDGRYLMIASVEQAGTLDGDRMAASIAGPSSYKSSAQERTSGGATDETLKNTKIVRLDAGDVVRLQTQNKDTACTVMGHKNDTFFQIQRLGPVVR